MKTMAPLAAALLLLGLSACTAPQEPRVDPNGPYPDAGLGNVPREAVDAGQLTVHAPRIWVDQDGRPHELPNHPGLIWDSSHEVSSGYRIFDQEGRLVTETPNHSPLVVTNEGPSELSLPPGRYLVKLDLPDGSARVFWVTIERQRRTEVDPARLGPNPPGR